MQTDPASRLERLVSIHERKISEAFIEALKLVRSDINLDDLANLLQTGRFDEAFKIVERAAQRLNVVWAEAFVAAGTSTGDWLTRNVQDVVINFDMINTRAVRAMRDNGLRLIQGFTEQQRRSTRQALVRGVQDGINPRQVARSFRNSIGLTAKQEQWVSNYERQLRQLDAGSLRRELRDRRFDRTVRRAINDREPLTERQISNMVKRYRERALKLRAETIARTEALRSVHAGSREMYDQAVDSGELNKDQLIRIWNTAGDERVRDFPKDRTSHRTMHNQERQFDEMFVSGAGRLALYPGSFGVANEDINCRCVVSTRILAFDEIPSFASASILR